MLNKQLLTNEELEIFNCASNPFNTKWYNRRHLQLILMKMTNTDYRLELANYSVDGRVTDIKEDTQDGVVPVSRLRFKYWNKKLWCYAEVTFQTDNPKVSLFEMAVKFVKRLK